MTSGDRISSHYSGEENWSRYMSAKCRRWSGKWTIFDPLTFEVEQTHKVTKRCRTGDTDLILEHAIEEDTGQENSIIEEDRKKTELIVSKEDAMQLKASQEKERKYAKPYISIKTKAGIFQHLTFDQDQEVMLSWDLRSGDFKCYQFTFKRAGIAHTLCYVHDSDWNPVILTMMQESTDIRDFNKLPDKVTHVSHVEKHVGEWKGQSKYLSVLYGKSASLETSSLAHREVHIKEMSIGPLAYSWGSDENTEISFSNGITLSIPKEPLKIIGGEFQVACQWIASDHEIRQIIVEYNNYLVHEMQALIYRRKDINLYMP